MPTLSSPLHAELPRSGWPITTSASRNVGLNGWPNAPLIAHVPADAPAQSESFVHGIAGAREHCPRLRKPRMRLLLVSATQMRFGLTLRSIATPAAWLPIVWPRTAPTAVSFQDACPKTLRRSTQVP